MFRQILDFTKEFSVLIVSQYDDFRQNKHVIRDKIYFHIAYLKANLLVRAS